MGSIVDEWEICYVSSIQIEPIGASELLGAIGIAPMSIMFGSSCELESVNSESRYYNRAKLYY